MSIRDRLAAHLPAYALEVRTPRLTLRFPDDADMVDLAELAALGIHDPDFLPFETPWSLVPSPRLERASIDFVSGARAKSRGDNWDLPLVTVVDGRIAGVQAVAGDNWTARRTVATGSWLGREFQGQGLGKEMRHAVLQLSFDGFGAVRAETGAWVDNPSSIGVTTSLGYRPNGIERRVRQDEPTDQARFVMDAEAFDAIRRDDIELIGVAAVSVHFTAEETKMP